MYLIFLFGISACLGGGETSGQKTEVSKRAYVVQGSAASTFEGGFLNFKVMSVFPSNEPQSLLWEITDEWGTIATPYFFSDNGSEMLLANQSEVYIGVFPLRGTIPTGGKKFFIRIYIGNETHIHQFRVKTFFDDDGEDDGTVHTVSITSFDNNKFVNRNNRNLYSVSGVCSTIGGGILVTATRDGNSVTKSEVCGSDQTWSAGLNLATLNDGVLSINVKHSLGGSIGEANDSVTKDTLPPSVALTS